MVDAAALALATLRAKSTDEIVTHQSMRCQRSKRDPCCAHTETHGATAYGHAYYYREPLRAPAAAADVALLACSWPLQPRL